MIGATLVLALGVTFLAVFRLSGSPLGADGLVWTGVWLVAIGCAMQLGAILDQVPLATIWLVILKTATWTLTLAATAWAVYLAPGSELLSGLLIGPPFVGTLGMVASRRDRPAALAFLALALGLSALFMLAALERLG